MYNPSKEEVVKLFDDKVPLLIISADDKDALAAIRIIKNTLVKAGHYELAASVRGTEKQMQNYLDEADVVTPTMPSEEFILLMKSVKADIDSYLAKVEDKEE